MMTRDRMGRVVVRACPGQRVALRQLAEALERRSGHDNAERIQRLRSIHFADVDTLEASGTVKLPLLGGGTCEDTETGGQEGRS